MTSRQPDIRGLTNRPQAEPDGDREPVDLRLAVGALAAWVAVIWGLGRSAGTAAVAAGTAVVLTVLLLGLARHRPRLLVVAFAACCVALVLPPLAARLHRAHDGDLSRLAREGVAGHRRTAGDR